MPVSSSNVDNTANQIIFKIGTTPLHGALDLNGVQLGSDGAFTEADVIAGNVTYEGSLNYSGSDSFNFSLSDNMAPPSSGTVMVSVIFAAWTHNRAVFAADKFHRNNILI